MQLDLMLYTRVHMILLAFYGFLCMLLREASLVYNNYLYQQNNISAKHYHGTADNWLHQDGIKVSYERLVFEVGRVSFFA